MIRNIYSKIHIFQTIYSRKNQTMKTVFYGCPFSLSKKSWLISIDADTFQGMRPPRAVPPEDVTFF
jgi:hypothetical protein